MSRNRRADHSVASSPEDITGHSVDESRILRLSVADQIGLVAAILDSPKPTPALLRAALAYRRLIGEGR